MMWFEHHSMSENKPGLHDRIPTHAEFALQSRPLPPCKAAAAVSKAHFILTIKMLC
jgi:hypothetical protein